MACRHLLMRNFRTNYTTNLWSGTCGTLLSTALLISCSYPWRSPPDSAQSLLGLSESSLVLPRVAVCFRYMLCCAALFVICVHARRLLLSYVCRVHLPCVITACLMYDFNCSPRPELGTTRCACLIFLDFCGMR